MLSKLMRNVKYVAIDMRHLKLFTGYFAYWYVRMYMYNLYRIHYDNLSNFKPGRIFSALQLVFFAPLRAYRITADSFSKYYFDCFSIYAILSESEGFSVESPDYMNSKVNANEKNSK